LIVVSNAFCGLSKPSKWRFLVKNSETEISRWRAAIVLAFSRGGFVFLRADFFFARIFAIGDIATRVRDGDRIG
jgi:hypothetical protein